MGTISDKLLYLNETKDELRDGINELVRASNEIDEDDTFRSYVEPLKSIRDRLPKVEGEGENITLDDTIEARIRKTLNGNTSQVRYSGKNLFNVDGDYANTGQAQKDTSITITNGIRVKATSTGNNRYISVEIPNSDNLLGKTCTLKGYFVPSASNISQISIYNAKSTNLISVGAYLGRITNSGGNLTITFPNEYAEGYDCFALVLYVNVSGTLVVGDYTDFTDIQLEEGSTATSYEPYTGGTPSPNPDYPQDIHSVSGDNKVEVRGGINLAYTNWASDFVSRINDNTSAKLETYDGKNCLAFYPSAGNGNYDNKYMFKPMGGFKENTQYTFKIDKYTTSEFGDMDIAYTDGSVDEIRGLVANSWNSIVKTSTANKTIKYLKARWRNNAWQYIDLDTFMVYEGTDTTQPYEPYIGNVYEINLPIENLFNKDDTNIILDYRIDATGGNYGHTGYYISPFIKVNPNTQYVKNSPNADAYHRFAFYTSNDISSVISTTTDNVITTPNNCNYLRFCGKQTEMNTAQLEKGTKANHYTPYGTTPIELCKIGNYQDYIYKSNGKWWLYKAIRKVLLNGSESWTRTPTGTTGKIRFFCNIDNNFATTDATTVAPIFSDKFKGVTRGNTYNLIQGIALSDYAHSYKSFLLYCDACADGDANALKTWLSSNNVLLYAPYGTPTTTEITDTTLLEQLDAVWYSQDGQTNISQNNNDQPFWLEVDALKDSDLFH